MKTITILHFYSIKNSLIHTKMINSKELTFKYTFLPTKAFMLTIIFTYLIMESCSINVTYAAGPSFVHNLLGVLQKSSADNKWIISKRAESLNIVQNGAQATFKISFINRSSNSNDTLYTLDDQPGTWTHIKSTKATLSCNMLYEANSKSVGFLKFDSTLKSLTLESKINLAIIKGNLTAPYSTMSENLLVAQMTPSESCDMFSINGLLWKIDSNSSISNINVPSGWRVIDYVESFKYGVTDGRLYKLSSYSYSSIYNFDKFTTWNIFEYNGRIIATGSNVTVVNANTNSFIQKIYILFDSINTTTLIKVISLTGTSDDDSIIPIYTSPKLTKFVYWILPIGSSPPMRAAFKSIDYDNKQVIDMSVDNPARLQYIFDGILSKQFSIGEYGLIVSNSSKGTPAYEQGYQFLGNKVVYLNNRQMTNANERNKVYICYVDPYYIYQVISVTIYLDGDNIGVLQTRFGIYADRRKVSISYDSFYLQIPMTLSPENSVPDRLMWGFITPQIDSTSIMIAAHVPSNTNHFESYTTTFNVSYMMLARAPFCRVYQKIGTNNFYLATYNSSSATPFLMTNLSPYVNLIGQPLNQFTDIWFLSDDCKRFSVKGFTFSQINGVFVRSTENISNFIISTADRYLTYVISGNSIYKYNSATNAYVRYLDKTMNEAVRSIYSYNNRVIILARNQTNFDYFNPNYVQQQVFIFIDNGTNLLPILNYQVVWGTIPNIQVSDKLAKIMIFGKIDNIKIVSAYSIDYTAKTSTAITFPMEGIDDEDPFYTHIKICQKYIYVRQIFNYDFYSNPNYTSISRQEFFYYFSGNVPTFMFKRSLTLDQANAYKKSLFLSDDDGANYYLAIESFQQVYSSMIIRVRTTLLDSKLLDLGDQTGYVSANGQIVLCNPGCSDCSSQFCTQCKSGYTLRVYNYQCMPCGPNCANCTSTDPLNCNTCFNGSYYSTKKCIPCDNSCLTCISGDVCSSCRPGYFLNGSQKCVGCKKNCQKCTSTSTCTKCRKGFIATSGGACRGCSLGCANCEQNNITKCTACSSGLYLVNNSCISCPSNCIECTNGICTKCVPGYKVDTIEGDCHLSCQLPCASCEQGKPTICKSCFSSATLTNGKCVYSDFCNTTGECLSCGVGLGYFLRDLYCINCSFSGNMQNCLQCSQLNPHVCSICENGYFIDSNGACQQCPTNCTSCKSSLFCTSCVQGSTLSQDLTQGKCFTCESPCLTCYGTPINCLTCVTGFTKDGWKCLNDTHIDITLTLTGNVSRVLSIIDAVISDLLTIIGQNVTNTDCVTITSVVQGSVVVSAVTSPITVPVATASTNLQTALSGGGATIGGLSVVSSSVAVDSGSGGSSSSSSSSQQQTNIPLIVGVTIGALFLVIAIIGIIFICLKKNSLSKTVGNMDSTTTKKHEKQMTIVQQIDDSKNGLDPTNSNSKIKIRP